MTTLLILSLLLVTSFVGVACKRRGSLPESISALVYEVPRRWQWVWIVWMWAVSVTACIPLISVLGEGLDILGFLTLALLVFCGAMPIYMKDSEREHTLLAIGAGIASQACVLFICPWWLIVWLAIVWLVCDAYIAEDRDEGRWYDKKGVLIAEVLCTVAVFGSVVTKSLTG